MITSTADCGSAEGVKKHTGDASFAAAPCFAAEGGASLGALEEGRKGLRKLDARCFHSQKEYAPPIIRAAIYS